MDSDNDWGIFYMKAVKERVFDVNLRIEDIIQDPVEIYSNENTHTTLMKGKYKGDKAVAKVFKVNTKEKAQSIFDNEVRIQEYFKDDEAVVQVYDSYIL